MVALVDAGGNIVTGDSTTTISAHMTPSLAYSSRVIIDTSKDSIPIVNHVVFADSISSDGRQIYGPGDIIRVDVVFSQEVTLTSSSNAPLLPRILLNVLDGGGTETVYGELASDSEFKSFSQTLSFEYMVKVGHSSAELDYLSEMSLIANDYFIEDAFGRSANLDLPAVGLGSSLKASKILGISDNQPTAESVSANLPSGVYGAGHEVHFVVSFDREVSQLPCNRPCICNFQINCKLIFWGIRLLSLGLQNYPLIFIVHLFWWIFRRKVR